MKIRNRIIGWWETAMVKQMNYPTKNTISVLMGVLMFGFFLGIMFGSTPMELVEKYTGIAIIGLAGLTIFAIACASYIFYDQVYKPMMAYEKMYGSCGLGNEWLEERRAKKQSKKPILQSKADTVT